MLARPSLLSLAAPLLTAPLLAAPAFAQGKAPAPEVEAPAPSGWGVQPALPVAGEVGANASYLSYYKLPATKFPIYLGEDKGGESYTRQAASFPSPRTDRWPLVQGTYYRPRHLRPGERVPAAVIVHHLGGEMGIYEYVGMYMAANGVAAYVIQLPNYGDRREPNSKQGFLRQPPLVAFRTFQQAALDVIRAGDFLRAQPEVDPDRVGLMGLSLGAFVASVARGVDPRLGRSVILLGGGDLINMVDLIPGAKDKVKEAGVDLSVVANFVRAVDPVTFADRVATDDVIMLNAEQDEIVPREATMSLWRAFGKPKLRWINTGHYGIVLHLPTVLNMALDHFKGRSYY